ncbi:MAG: S8 family serine peptidase [Oscillospiraceae bacterium]|jgi:uncharacterized repeat protein (TIGR02543 family)|nr:S8 family serine peptidase [Oscillospiraceae bacterium]
MRQIRTLTIALLALVQILTLGLWPAAPGAAAAEAENVSAAAPGESAERYVLKLQAGAVWPADLFDGPGGAPALIPYTDDLYVADTWAQVIALVRAGLVEFFAKDEPLRLLEGIETGAGQYRRAVGIDALWDAGYDGTGVTVAVVDSGVYAGHEDLDAGRFDGANFIGYQAGASPARDYGVDATGHGTFVSGVISAVRDNGVGVDGLAGGARLLIARCFPEKGIQTSEVLAAIGYAVAQNADVINMSFGGAGSSVAALMRVLLEEARRKGIILVAAAGNDGVGGEVQYPAGSDGVIGVGMVDAQGRVSGQSTQNRTVDVTAPGLGMAGLGTEAPNHYITGSGTSYAAPVVAALAALARQADAGLDGEDFLALLKESAEDRGAPGYDEGYGWGVVVGARLLAALERARAIRYETDGGRIEGTAGADYSTVYTVARDADARLPASVTRAGSLFAGWYDNPDGAGAPLTAVPPGTVSDVTYYARWVDVSDEFDAVVARLRVDGVSAERTGETAFHAVLPAGTDLAGLTAQEIEIEPANAQTTFSVPETADGGVTWTFSGSLPSGGGTHYTLTVGLSDVPRPEAGPDVTGAAAPASLDEKTPAAPFQCELTGAFRGVTGGTVYEVTGSDGAGAARIDGTKLIYTPAPLEAGRTVTLLVRAQTGSFAARSDLRVTVTVGALPVSDAMLSPTEGVYDRAASGAAGMTVLAAFYGHRLVAVERAGTALVSGADYREEPTIGEIRPVTLTDAFLRGLPDGVHTLVFWFSGGRTEAARSVPFVLTVRGGENPSEGTKAPPGGPADRPSLTRPAPAVIAEESEEDASAPPDESEADETAGTSDAPPPFGDVTVGDWFCDDVRYLYERGLMVGTAAGRFTPHASMTRGMLVTVLGRLAGADAARHGENHFDDVSDGRYDAPYIEWARAVGIVLGVGGARFVPDRAVTRQEAAVILLRYLQFAGLRLPETAAPGPFTDEARIAGYAREAVAALIAGGVITGRPGPRFDPGGTATRAEVAAMLHRLCTMTEAR